MEHPARYWISYLITKRHALGEIPGLCELINLGGVDPWYINGLSQEIDSRRPRPFRGFDKRHAASVAFLRSEKLFDAWHQDDDMRDAIDALGHARVRPLLETFLLSSMKPRQVATAINRAEDVGISEKTVSLYRHYFWNRSLLSPAEWGKFVAARDVAHDEWLRLAVTAQGPEGVRLLLWRTGAGPLRHMDAASAFGKLRDIAVMKAFELEFQDAGKDHSTALKNYVQAAKMSQEEVAVASGGALDVLDSFKAFRMELDARPTVTIKQITGEGGSLSQSTSAIVEDDSIDIDEY